MKKILAVILAAVCVLCFSGCGISFTAEKIIDDSEIYSKKDIEEAMNVVCREFCDLDFCILLELKYDEKFSNNQMKYNTELYKADEAIVLCSEFINLKKGNIMEWSWILVRYGGGPWELKSYGYG